MRTYQLHNTAGEEILVECDQLDCDHASGRILVVKGNVMKAYLASTIVSYHEITTAPRGEAQRDVLYEPATPAPAHRETASSVTVTIPGSIPPLA